MIKSIAENKWLHQLAVFVAYGAIFALLRPYSNGIWAIASGLRLSCLLLLPYRYWPTLALAEFGPLVYQNHQSLELFGPAWMIWNSIPAIVYAMPIVVWCKRRLGLFPSKHLVKAKALLICIALAAAVWTVAGLPALLVVVQPPGTLHPYQFSNIQIVMLFFGRYIGILTLLPAALMLKLQKPQPWRARLVNLIGDRLTQESLVILLPMLAVLYWLNRHVPQDFQQITRMTMLLPVAWLTMKHGWRAAAIGIASAMICIFSDLEPTYEKLDVIATQAFIAFSITSLFALGVRVSIQNAVDEQERVSAKAAVRVARQGLYLCEVRMRQASQTLEKIAGTLQLTQTRLLNRFKHMLPPMEGQSYYKQMANTQSQVYQLVESMHPIAWRERGLPAALRETIGRPLDEAGIAYRFELTGRGLSQLSPGVHAAIYRLACEAVVHVFARQAWSTITISLRGGFTHGQRWVTLRVEGKADHMETALPMQRKQECQHLAAKLGANSLGVMAMRDYAQLYNGQLHTFTKADAFRITALMHDVSQHVPQSVDVQPVSLDLYIR